MGLDSVELLMGFEDYFGFQVPDGEAAEIGTVQEMVDCVARHLNIENADSHLKVELLKKLNVALTESGISNSSLSDQESIFKVLNPDDQNVWTDISNRLGLVLPIPYRQGIGKIKRFLSKVWIPRYNWETITTDQFITAIAATNYEKLVDQNNIKDQFEILVGIVAITVDKIGVDPYEVQPRTVFAHDLGID